MPALPEFLEAFAAGLRQRLAGVQVVDGPPVDFIQPEIVAVGLSTEDALVQSETVTAGLSARKEQVDVINLIRVWSGDVDMTPIRRRGFELLDAFDAHLQADPSVDGTVGRARVLSYDYNPVRTKDGAGVFLVPRVRVDAFPS